MSEVIPRLRVVRPGDPHARLPLTVAAVLAVDSAELFAYTLDGENIDLVILDQHIDTTTAQGRLFFTILAAFAEFERELIVERTKDGLAATKARP